MLTLAKLITANLAFILTCVAYVKKITSSILVKKIVCPTVHQLVVPMKIVITVCRIIFVRNARQAIIYLSQDHVSLVTQLFNALNTV